jgi:hypothetical protein
VVERKLSSTDQTATGNVRRDRVATTAKPFEERLRLSSLLVLETPK